MSKGVLGVNWGALGRFAGAALTGDVKEAMEVLAEKPDETVKPPESPPDAGGGCGKRDGEWRCVAHGGDGACLMSKGGG